MIKNLKQGWLTSGTWKTRDAFELRNKDGDEVYLWMEDAQARWLFHIGEFLVDSRHIGADAEVWKSLSGKNIHKDMPAARLVVGQVTAKDEVRIPFVVKNVPLSMSDKK